MSKTRKVPKRGPARYKHAYNAGYRAGINRVVKPAVDSFRKKYPKIAALAKHEFGVQVPTVAHLPDENSIKWLGFTEAMQLIIRSRG